MKCRHCRMEVHQPFIDLGTAPPSNAYLSKDALSTTEKRYPLRVLVCTTCWLVQTEDYTGREELFSSDYAYFSSYSSSWLEHARRYVQVVSERFNLAKDSMVAEIASNDGYLLQFVQQRGIPCYGVEPTHGTASVARSKGLTVFEEFFGMEYAKKLAASGRTADLAIANNVLAHVSEINDFVSGFTLLLKPHGVATFEFPQVLNLVEQNQFDTIYHEHYSYLSLTSVQRILFTNGLTVFDVEQFDTHGGSLRVYAQRSDYGNKQITSMVKKILEIEKCAGVETYDFYSNFQNKVTVVKDNFLNLLIKIKEQGESIGAYGAAAKGNTLLNYAEVKPDLLPYVADRNPAKQDKYLPGSLIPIVNESHLKTDKPKWVLILPWNLKDEIVEQLGYIRAWGGRFILAIPKLEIL